MKWLKENWTKVILIIAGLLLAWFIWGDVQNKKEIERLEDDIELRQDSIIALNTLVELSKEKAENYEEDIDSLEIVIADKEGEIEVVEGNLADALKEVDNLTPTQNVSLLAGNLSKEMQKTIELELRPDSTISLEIEEVRTVNKVFIERDSTLKKLDILIDINLVQTNEINTQKLLIMTHKETIGLLEKTIGQKDAIILDKNGIIVEKDKKANKDKTKFFGIGAGSGAALILLIILL